MDYVLLEVFVLKAQYYQYLVHLELSEAYLEQQMNQSVTLVHLDTTVPILTLLLPRESVLLATTVLVEFNNRNPCNFVVLREAFVLLDPLCLLFVRQAFINLRKVNLPAAYVRLVNTVLMEPQFLMIALRLVFALKVQGMAFLFVLLALTLQTH
jgi:hypothetical protein